MKTYRTWSKENSLHALSQSWATLTKLHLVHVPVQYQNPRENLKKFKFYRNLQNNTSLMGIRPHKDRNFCDDHLYILQISYYFSNTFFVALKNDRDTSTKWDEEQRFMYLRVRRIVNAHNRIMTKSKQYKRERHLRNATANINRPRNTIYIGYGMPHHTFFYYGVMNHGKVDCGVNNLQWCAMFLQPRSPHTWINYEKVNCISLQNFKSNFISEAYTSILLMHNISRNIRKRNYLGLRIMAKFQCTKNLAPYKIMNEDNRRHCDTRAKKKKACWFNMSLTFLYRGARHDQLPTKYKCVIKQS